MVRKEFYFQTGQFMKLGPTYQRHCGPTAITNLVYTLAARTGTPLEKPAEEVFTGIAGIGKRRATYVNASIMGRFGGTSDFLAPAYIRACLKKYGIRGYSARGIFWASAKRITALLDRGAVIYLELHHHPKYGSHHMLCYGYRYEGSQVIYRCADGWSGKPVELPAMTLGFALYTAIVPIVTN
jgi:hypothetical protein